MNVCITPDCDKPVHGYGYCSTHYYQARERGDLWPLRAKECEVVNCQLKTNTMSDRLCSRHYGRAKGHGLSTDQLVNLIGVLGGRCWICRYEGNVVDHDHKCPRHYSRKGCDYCVRGWLCSGCNLNLLGKAIDSVERLEEYRRATSRPLITRDTESFARAKLYLQAGSGDGRFQRLVDLDFFAEGGDPKAA